MMNGGPPFMAYHGTRVARLGTSPIAIAVPAAEGEPLLLDLATSVVSNGRLYIRDQELLYCFDLKP